VINGRLYGCTARKERGPKVCEGVFVRRDPLGAYRALLMRLETALAADTARAREALRQVLGDARLVAEDDTVNAEIETRADRLLLDAMGAGVVKSQEKGDILAPFSTQE